MAGKGTHPLNRATTPMQEDNRGHRLQWVIHHHSREATLLHSLSLATTLMGVSKGPLLQ